MPTEFLHVDAFTNRPSKETRLGVAPDLADEITAAVKIPTIGIGASQGCDGQILVTDDMFGLFDWAPKFVRRYADLRSTIDSAVSAYATDVRAGSFPSDAKLYRIKKE